VVLREILLKTEHLVRGDGRSGLQTRNIGIGLR